MILARDIKNKQEYTIRDAWKYLHNILQSRGNTPNIYIMDIEAYSDMKEAMKKYGINNQLDPTHMHLRTPQN